MTIVRAFLLTSGLGLAAAAGAQSLLGATGRAPSGSTGRAPFGATASAPAGSQFRGGGYAFRSGLYPSRGGTNGYRSGSQNSDHGHGYRGPSHRYGVVAPFFYGLPYDADTYYGNYGEDDGTPYADGPGPAAADPLAQHYIVQENILGDEIRQLNSKIEEMQQQNVQPPLDSATRPAPSEPAAPPTPPVTVVLRSGQRFQSNSYAVMNNTFWDFSKSPVRRVPMVDVDVPASVQATAQSGAEFPE